MNTIHGSESLAILTLAVVLLGGFIYYIFRQSSKLTGNIPSTAQIHAKMGAALKNYQEGHYREALEQWPGLIQDFERSGNIAGIVAVSNLTGHTLEKLGDYEDAARAYKATMSVAHREEYEDSLEVAYRRYCMCQLLLGNPLEAGNSLHELSEIYRREGDLEKAVRTLLSLAHTFRNHGYLEQAAAAFADALALSTQYENQEARAMVLHDQALFLLTMGKLREALECVQEAAQIRLGGENLEGKPRRRRHPQATGMVQEMKRLESQAHMLSTQTNFLRQLGRIDEARASCGRTLEIARNAGSQRFIGIAELEGSLIAWATGQRDEAQALLRRAVEAAAADDESEDRKPVNAIFEASYAEQSGNCPIALAVLAIAEKLFPSMKPNVKLAYFNVKCRALAKSGQHHAATAELEKASALAAKLKTPHHLAETALAAGMVAHHRGDHEEAAQRLQQALDFYKNGGFKRDTATTQKYRAAALKALGRSAESAAAKEEANRIYFELGDTASAAEL